MTIWTTQMRLDTISLTTDAELGAVTVITGTFRDQAELRGLMDRIYNLNLALISVQHVRHDLPYDWFHSM